MTVAKIKSKFTPDSALFLRYAGIDMPAAQVVALAQQRGALPVTFLSERAEAALPGGDFALVDSTLAVADQLPAHLPPPAPGLGYTGFSAAQRGALLAWIEHPVAPAPVAFQQLLLANSEVRLLEDGERAARVHQALLALADVPPWHSHAGLARTLLLSFWLRQDGAGLLQWLESFSLPAELWRTALGLQALLAQPLHCDQLPPLAPAWQLPVPAVNEAVLRLRLDSLQTALGQEPLAYSLAKLGDAARTPLPWRCQHRDLRLALPQPDLRPLLEPLLRDLLAVIEPVESAESAEAAPAAVATQEAGAAEPDAPTIDKHTKKRKQERDQSDGKAHLILEFGASRSDVFDYVLRQAQKQPGFQQIMDENRHIVYRVPFRRSDMRHFWQIWGYVQNWSSMRVYCEGRQLDKWQIYPYSQYLR